MLLWLHTFLIRFCTNSLFLVSKSDLIRFMSHYIIWCHHFIEDRTDPIFLFFLSESFGNKAAGASSLECLSSIVDRLSSVESSCGPVALRDMATFSPGSSDSQPCTPESPGSRPVYHVLWRKSHLDKDILPQSGTVLYQTPAAIATSSDKN